MFVIDLKVSLSKCSRPIYEKSSMIFHDLHEAATILFPHSYNPGCHQNFNPDPCSMKFYLICMATCFPRISVSTILTGSTGCILENLGLSLNFKHEVLQGTH